MTGADESLTVIGTCQHDCPDTCGWEVTVERGRAVKLRGRESHPASGGELCPKVNRYLDRVYGDQRVLTPLLRAGPKGEGTFVPISWAEALDRIASRFGSIIDQHGPSAIVPFTSAGNQGALAMFFGDRFWNRLGATRLTGALCGSVAVAGLEATNGTAASLDPAEIGHARLIILWATNTRLTNRHLWRTIESAREGGAQLVVVDPVRTATADLADWHVQPRPGTDVALMLAMIHVLVRDGLVDRSWVDEHTVGFDELQAAAAAWTPRRAEDECGVPADDIERLARVYGTVRPAAIRTLIGAEHHEHGAMFFRTLACLPALVGAWSDRGGGLALSVYPWTTRPIDLERLRGDHLASAPRRELPLPAVATWLADEHLEPPVEALVVVGSNPAVSVPDVDALRRALRRESLFTIVHEQFLTDTAKFADIVLPATTAIEAHDIVPGYGHLWIGWNEPAIAPVGECVSNAELHRRLARAMGFGDAELFEDDLDVLAGVLSPDDLSTLRTDGWLRAPYPDDGRPHGHGGFTTPSGKVELASPTLATLGLPRLPNFDTARESSASAAVVERHPFQLLTPKRHIRFLNTGYAHLPHHGPPEGGPRLEIHPDDAAGLGLDDGAVARVHNDRGSLSLRVSLSDRLPRRVVAVPWGWWADHHEDDNPANVLTSAAPTDWGGGVALSSTMVAIEAGPP